MGCSNTVLEGTAVWRYECTLLQGSMATSPSYNPDMTPAAEMEDLTVGKICKKVNTKVYNTVHCFGINTSDSG